jgi:Phage portal protein, SPP1 Gp6-like
MAKLLSSAAAIEQARRMHQIQCQERERLDNVRRYWKGRQKLPAVIPVGTPGEVRVMERSSRVNIMPIVINSLVQSTFVEGFRAKGESDDEAVWSAWQANRMDARQTAIHRAAYAYGTSYAIVLPGDPEPVIRGVSPRSFTALYGEDPHWPMWGLERCGGGLYKLYDDKAYYYVYLGQRASEQDTFIESREHGADVVPAIRFLDEDDLDDEDEVEADGDHCPPITRGQVAPLMPIQDQIDLTTFGLHIAQHYTGFRQRYIIGWVGDNEAETLKVAANRIIAIDESPEGEDGVKVGEFNQTDLSGFLESREASLRHAATLSQTPVHELIGELVNMSAEALAAAEAGRDRKIAERQTLHGESHEQMFWLVGRYKRVTVPIDAEVKWRDTSARAFAAVVDGLGKIATMLEVPPEELWERIPGTTKQDINRWKKARERGGAFQQMTALLERQAV